MPCLGGPAESLVLDDEGRCGKSRLRAGQLRGLVENLVSCQKVL